jgi:tetratricopeptide (TPR) repeat protein
MWWAFNDFVRNRHQINIDAVTSKEMSLKVWYRNRKKILEGIELFNRCREYFNENLRILIDLYKLRYTSNDEEYEAINLDIIEIYRQLGEFEEAKALLEQTTRRTHFISTIERKVDERDDLVFLVSG